MPEELNVLRAEAADLLLEWARQAAPHYGPVGSMDLDRDDFPDAAGPSYYNQFAHFSMLLLSEGIVPGATTKERESFRSLAIANLRYILSITDSDFHTPHYSRGRDWGRHVGEWLNYYALESLQLMEAHDVGGAELRQALRVTIEAAVSHIAMTMISRFGGNEAREEAPITFPGNHATWHGLLVYRAGHYFERPEWVQFADDFFARWILPTQLPDGVWPEGEGIVVDYSMVTAQAVSLYAEASDCDLARGSMARALGFFLAFQLPDGSSAVVVDGRMRHRPRPMLFFPPGFLRDPAGRTLCLDRVRGGLQDLRSTEIADNGAQGLAFYGAFVQALMTWDDMSDIPSVVAPEGLPAARIDVGPWTAMLGWQLTPEHTSRFILESQNFVEVYHADSGYLVGTGNSKFTPRFSTLRRRSAGRDYIPSTARCVRTSAAEIVALYELGADQVEVSLVHEGDGLVVRFHQLTPPCDIEAGLMLGLGAGEQIDAGGTSHVVAPTALIDHTFTEEATVLRWGGRSFDVPAGSRLEYPIIPHNPYTQTGLPGERSYVARLSIPLGAGPALVTIR